MEIEDFVTVILADFAPGEVRLVNCGHHPPLKVSADSAELQLMMPGQPAPPLGLQPCPSRQDITLKPGDRLLFYTDGLSIPTAWSRPAIARTVFLTSASKRLRRRSPNPTWTPPCGGWSACSSSTRPGGSPTTSCWSSASPV
jgi:hypothetical protein